MRMGRNKIKPSLDTLPTGICFFSAKGILALSNEKMQELAYHLQGKDLQLLQELRESLEKPAEGVRVIKSSDSILYQMPDQSIWEFKEQEVITENKRMYTQITATDLTDLYHLQQEVDKQNEQLSEMIEQVNRITQSVAEVTRQQEILTAKMRIHNKMGNCLLSARQYLVQGFPKQKKEALIEIWEQSLHTLQGEVEAEDERDALEEVIAIAKRIGVDVEIQGDATQNAENSYLFVIVLRECVTNTIQHAGGNHITVTMTKESGKITAIYTNNGKQPESEITEGGGLTSLRERIERAGGTMKVNSFPRFALIVTLSE